MRAIALNARCKIGAHDTDPVNAASRQSSFGSWNRAFVASKRANEWEIG
jgi:hypothetical protein